MIGVHTTRVFKSGNSQAVRIPKEFQVAEKELLINKVGSALILFPKNDPWALLKQSLTEFSEDFMAGGRKQPGQRKRGGIGKMFS
jgi:antitoxin VapB